ncbi:electron transport complex subunit RsxE, partial [candidate division KSB1 bacterium]
GLVREILGNGTIYGYPVFGSGYNPMLIMILPPGAFLILGLYLGFFNWLDRKRKVS